MHNYSSAREFLESVRHARIEQRRLQERIAELESRCEKITPTLDNLPGGGNADAQRMWSALADERSRLYALLAEELRATREVETFIGRLRRPMHRDVLALRYINQMTVPQMQEHLRNSGYERSQRQIERLLYWALLEAETLWLRDHPETDYDYEEDYDNGNEERGNS